MRVRLNECAETRLRVLLLISRELRRNDRIKLNATSDNSIEDRLPKEDAGPSARRSVGLN